MINFIGKLTRQKVNVLYGKSRAGIVIYQPAKNHFESQPIKLFEFMAAGLPVVASNFTLWKQIVEGSGCGICVDPTDANAVRQSCLYLLDNPAEAEEMGKAGHRAVISQYNWTVEEKKLLKLYSDLTKEEDNI